MTKETTVMLVGTPLERKLEKYLDEEFNVLFVGKHGTGKTTIVKALWENKGLNYRIFSASTMDPWVDFIGVPKEKTDENGNCYLELIRPREFQDDEVEAIFFDEYNRSHQKIRNAVMELIQFKSINDREFKNLKVVWAAINPEDDEELKFDVEALDPAQKDRFQIHIDMPYEPCKEYFTSKYGKDTANAAVDWWKSLKKDSKGKATNEIINKISPRRLDYAIEAALKNCDLEDVLPKESNPFTLKEVLAERPIVITLEKMMKNNEYEKATKFLEDENNYDYAKNIITFDVAKMHFFLPLLRPEKLNALMSSNLSVRTWAMQNINKCQAVMDAAKEILEAGLNTNLCNQIKKRMKVETDDSQEKNLQTQVNPNAEPIHHVCKNNKEFIKAVAKWEAKDLTGTDVRRNAVSDLADKIPFNMDSEVAMSTLQLLDKIIHVSNNRMFNRWENSMGMINNCVNNLDSLKYDFVNFKDDFSNVLMFVSDDQYSDKFWFKVA